MWTAWVSLLVLALLCFSAAAGFYGNSFLAETHRSSDSMELMQSAITLLVTFVAIVLGLMTNSVKNGFDSAYGARAAYAGELAQFGRCLSNYGPETDHMREQLKAYVAAVIASTWPNEPPPTGVTYPDTSHMARTGESSVLATLLNDVGFELHSLQPPDELHRNLLAACTEQYAQVQTRRWNVIEGVRGSISLPFFWVLLFWLVVLFASFGLRAPPNRMSVIILGLCAICVSLAVFVIVDLNMPYGGFFGIPSMTMRNALADLMQ